MSSGKVELTRVTLVGVALKRLATLGDLEDDLVEGVGTATENLAGVAVAQDVRASVLVERSGPLDGTAVADSVVARHCDLKWAG